jgi:hypothetical protein
MTDKFTYPKSWDEPHAIPEPISGALRKALVDAQERTLAMSPEEKQAMFEAQKASWLRGMGPCEHGDCDWETCAQCLATPQPDTMGVSDRGL